jgi:RNA polymerase sigma-70 factor (sigma-E family)
VVLSPELPLTDGPTHFDTYVHDRSAALLRLAFLLTGDAHLAEDLVQASLVKVMGKWDAVAAGGDPHPYVRTVVLRTALGWRRRHWNGERPSDPVPERADTTDAAGTVVARERLRCALLALPHRQRAAVVLRHYEDLSEADVARALHCSVGTVKSQTARGLERLRTLLDDEPRRNP